jgi:hypothetical protein
VRLLNFHGGRCRRNLAWNPGFLFPALVASRKNPCDEEKQSEKGKVQFPEPDAVHVFFPLRNPLPALVDPAEKLL